MPCDEDCRRFKLQNRVAECLRGRQRLEQQRDLDRVLVLQDERVLWLERAAGTHPAEEQHERRELPRPRAEREAAAARRVGEGVR